MKQPHILLITSDQHRGDCLGVAGHPCIRTPHLDALAYAGMRFDHSYSNCPVCIPARTSLITGRDAHTNGSPSYNEQFRVNRKKDQFLGSLMTNAGYQTCLIGKSHWHTEPSFRAGFEQVIPLTRLMKERLYETGRPTKLSGMGGNEMSPTTSQFPPRLSSTQWIIDQGLQFLEDRDRTAPFFLWTSFIDPHPPIIIHEPYYSMYDAEQIPESVIPSWADDDTIPRSLYIAKWSSNPGPMTAGELRKAKSVYYGMITHLDHQLGRLFGMLMKQGLWDDTLVIYTTDHGEMLGDFGSFRKSAFTENAAQIPFIVKSPKWLNSAPGTVSSTLVELSDLLPTFCDFAGIAAPDDVTGSSLRPVLEGRSEQVRSELHGQIGDAHMYHDGRHKYLYFADDGKELLFDTSHDRKDEHDLSADTALLDSMRTRFVEHLSQENHPHWQDGALLNKQAAKPPVASLRAKAINGCKWSVSEGL